jgi:adenylate cyclase, class 2
MKSNSRHPPRRNIELKSSCSDLARARAAALRLGAADAGVLEQTDTYFHCHHGRLKLRETAGRGAELIAYARDDRAEARASEYHLIPVAEPDQLKAGLAGALGVRVVVVKRRELLLWRNVRIHLDRVEGLGGFVEFEAVLSDGDGTDEASAHDRVATLADALHLREEDRVAKSYADLIEATGPARYHAAVTSGGVDHGSG